MIEITDKKIDVAVLLESVLVPEAGGIDLFLGTTRNHSAGKKVVRLEYEAYTPMAVKVIGQIENEIRVRWNIHKISVVHRIGVVPLEEASVGIAVSASHRNEAFEACRYAIDQLKKSAPIWKKEIFENGEAWVEEGRHVEKSRTKRK